MNRTIKKFWKTSKLVLPIVVSFFCVASCANSGEKTETQQSAAEEKDPKALEHENTLLWKVTGNGLKEPSYLFGTIHIIGQDDFVMGKTTEERFAQCETLVTEVEIAELMLAGMMAMGETPLSEIFSEDEYARIIDFSTSTLGITQEQFEMIYGKMKPVMVQQAFTAGVFGKETKSYELEFSSMADDNDMVNVGLETAKEQMGFFDQIPLEDQKKMLLEGIDNYEKDVQSLLDLIEVYKKQEINKMLELSGESSFDMEKFEDILLNNRNKNWIPKLKDYMSEGPCFIAVGAAHLPGDLGVINLLKEEGFTLTPISTN